jgi:6-phosphogluconolactonase/glucosamine-6-phosphate isomerase/deaminase
MSINFITIDQATNSAPADFLAQVLSRVGKHGQKILWFIPGGSGLAIAVATAQRLVGQVPANLTVMLTDERYGPVGHADSNWQQLLAAGFTLPGAVLIPVLNAVSLEETARAYNQVLQRELAAADYKLGLFGLGVDGHTAGILPHSPAVFSADLACAYDAGNFQRLTMTPRALAWLDEAVVYAVGTNKRSAWAELAADVNINDQPAQALKQIPKLTIFSDYNL